MMKTYTNSYILLSLTLLICSAFVKAQTNPNWIYLRPSNSGLGGDFLQCIRVDECGNKWTGGYLPFFSEGSVSRFDDSVFTCWSNFEGYLPADRVYDLAFDSNGGLWVATNGVGNGIAHGGIAHFNGTTWTNYTSANTPMPDDDMRGICIDGNGNVWATFYGVGTGIGGVAKFDGASWTIYTPSNSNLQSSQVDKIISDSNNNIWIGTNVGLVRFDGTNWILYTTQNSGLSNNDITDVEFDITTNKIYAAAGNAINVFDGTTWTRWDNSNSPLSATGLWSVCAQGDRMIVTTVGGTYLTYIYDGTGWTTHPELDHTYDCRIDNEGNYWICGIGFLEKYDGTSWTTYSAFNTGLPSMFNNDVFVDSRNRIWFGSSGNGGISMFDCPQWQDYNPYNHNLFQQPVNYTGYGTGITESSNGDIWMVFNGVAGAAVQVTGGDVNDPAAWHVWNNNNSGVSLQFMYRTAADDSGNVWFGYDQVCSVSKYNNGTNSWTNYNLYSLGQNTCGAGSGIKSIRVDDSSNVWVCGAAGLARYDHTSWTFYSHLNTPMQQGTIYDIAFDTLGNKWIATEHGLYRWDGVNWTTYDSSNTIMYGDNVKCVLVDDDGIVWVGAGSETWPYPYGLYSFDGNSWTVYDASATGLPEKYVDRLALDAFGNIVVMTTGKGTAIFNPSGVIGYDCIDRSLRNCVFTDRSEVAVSASDKINIYPNPVSTHAIIELNIPDPKNFIITLEDGTGRMVKKFSLGKLQSGINKITIDLTDLSSGIYFCTLKGEDQVTTVKIIKS